MEIHVLSRQGLSIKAIARQLGLSRNTVRRYLRHRPRTPQYASRALRPTKLEPFHAYLGERIEAAHPFWIPATVLLREIREQGYTGGISQLKAFIGSRKPRNADPVVRFETGPGEQMQVDFTTIRRGRQPLKAFVATLGYSRATYVRFFERENSDAWLTGIREALIYFGGVPHELLFDNAKAIILERDAYGPGKHRWHPDLLSLADEFGFRPRVCRPYRAKTKGKVERFNRYLKESFVTPLAATLKSARLLLDVLTANAHVGRWLHDVANQRIHATTQEQPVVRLAKEQHHFLPLPEASIPLPARAVRPLGIALPIESFQHPLAVYDQLLRAAS